MGDTSRVVGVRVTANDELGVGNVVREVADMSAGNVDGVSDVCGEAVGRKVLRDAEASIGVHGSETERLAGAFRGCCGRRMGEGGASEASNGERSEEE